MKRVEHKSIKEALEQPQSEHFWVSTDGGKIKTGNRQSFYSNLLDDHLTFDISNNKVMANMDRRGCIKHISMFRDCYYADYAPGIWVFKDYSTTGPYAFSISIDGETYDLSATDRPTKTSLLDNIFPVSTILLDKMKLTLVMYCPISADGEKRLRVLVYGMLLENISAETAAGGVFLPKIAANDDFVSVYDGANVHAVITPADGINSDSLDFNLSPGQSVWIPCVISAPGSFDADEVIKMGTLYWLNETWTYYKTATGELSMPEDSFSAEFFKRALCQCMEFAGMNDAGNIVGATWGTYPTTRCVWGRDFHYGTMPISMFDPELYKKCILWANKYSVRPKSNRYEGGVTHSIGNSLAPVCMMGFYYSGTGDADFFTDNPELKNNAIRLLDEVLASRTNKNIWLCPSKFVSDGISSGDYHTGSNIFIWYCMKSLARILQEVYGEEDLAAEYLITASKMKSAIDSMCVIDGPFGRQYIEGVNADGSIPKMEHEGEESDSVLIPVYGYERYDNQIYRNYAKFALSEHNESYNKNTRGIKWGNDATMTGYMNALASLEAEYDRESNFMTEIRKLTDFDGSIWWWPYVMNGRYGEVCRMMGKERNDFFGSMDVKDYPGKCGWASGVFVSLFAREILGVEYDAPGKTLRFKPFSPSSVFEWKRFKMGAGAFGISFKKADVFIEIKITNENGFEIKYELEIPISENKTVSSFKRNNETLTKYVGGTFLNNPTICSSGEIKPSEYVEYRVGLL